MQLFHELSEIIMCILIFLNIISNFETYYRDEFHNCHSFHDFKFQTGVQQTGTQSQTRISMTLGWSSMTLMQVCIIDVS